MHFNKILSWGLLISVIVLLFIKHNVLNNWLEPVKETYEYYENGNVKKITLFSKLDTISCYKYFYEKGNIAKKICEDRNGIILGPYEVYYMNGEKNVISNFINGKLYGSSKRYYKNGNLSEDLFFENGIKNGVQYSYLKNGKLKAMNYFSKDTLIHKIIYDYGDTTKVEVYETYNPIVKLKKDTILIGDSIHVVFSLPFDKNYEHGKEYYIVKFDFQKMSENGGGVVFPKIADTLKNGRLESNFKVNIKGHHWIYGFIESPSGDTLLRSETFERSFYVN